MNGELPAGIERSFLALNPASAVSNPVGHHTCQGLWYKPRGATPKIAFIATHYNVDFSEHYLACYLAARGFGFLGWNTRFRGADNWFFLEHALVDIDVGVRWLRESVGIEHVVLLGNSGGGSLMAAYQSQATDPNITATRGLMLSPALSELERGDSYVSLQAHPGRPEVLTSWLDPSVTDEDDPLSRDPALDMYNPDNGPPYPPEFVRTYREAQRLRNDRITRWAIDQLEACTAVGSFDRNFSLHRTWADMRFVDPTLDPSDRPPNSCYLGSPKWANSSPYGLAAANTLRSWLSMWSLAESQCTGTPHLNRIKVPCLVIQSSADSGVFPSDASTIFEALGTADKELIMIEGDHYLQSPDHARDTVADLIGDWIAKRT